MSNYKIDRFLNSRALSASIFVLTGASKTYSDYKNADGEYKKKFLIKDTLILSGAATGMLLQKTFIPDIEKVKILQNLINKASKHFAETKFATKFRKPLSVGQEIISDTIKNVSMFACGIAGALLVDLALSKLKILNTEGQNIKSNDILNSSINGVENVVDKGLNLVIKNEEIKDAIYERTTDMPQLSILTKSFVGIDAIDLAKETNLKTKLKHTANCLINNSMLPMLYLSIANILTKGINPKYKIPAIFSILVLSTLITDKLSNIRIALLSQKEIIEKLSLLNNSDNTTQFKGLFSAKNSSSV